MNVKMEKATSKRIRFNFSEINPEKISETPQGGIIVEGVVIRTGVFQYQQEDGSVVNEFLPKEELFCDASLKSLVDAPITNEHPEEMISAANYRVNVIGFVKNVRNEGDRLVVADLVINDGETINEIITGKKKELSAGYFADPIKQSGVCPDGEKFDVIQRNIVFNHCSVVQMGRCGSEVSLRLNSAGHQVDTDDSTSGTAPNTLFNGKSQYSGKKSEMTVKKNEEHLVREDEEKGFCVPDEDGEVCFKTREEAEAHAKELDAKADEASDEASDESENSRQLSKLNSLLEKLGMKFDTFIDKANVRTEQLKNVFEGAEAKENDKKENSKSFEDKVKTEVLERINLLVAAKELNVLNLTGQEGKEELQLLIVETTKPHMDIKGRSDDFILALLEDSLSTVKLGSFWTKPSKTDEDNTDENEAGNDSAETNKNLNSVLSAVRGRKNEKRVESDIYCVEESAQRLVNLRNRNLC